MSVLTKEQEAHVAEMAVKHGEEMAKRWREHYEESASEARKKAAATYIPDVDNAKGNDARMRTYRRRLQDTVSLPPANRARIAYDLRLWAEDFKSDGWRYDFARALVTAMTLGEAVEAVADLLIDPDRGTPVHHQLRVGWYTTWKEQVERPVNSHYEPDERELRRLDAELRRKQLRENRQAGMAQIAKFLAAVLDRVRREELGALSPLAGDGALKTNYLIEGVLAERQPCVIGGVFKGGKTQMAVELGACLAGGRAFLNKYPVPNAVKVAIFSGESGAATLDGYLHRMGGCPEGLRVYPFLPCLATVEKLLERDPADVVILDPLYRLLDGSAATNLYQMGKQIMDVFDAIASAGATPIVVHHSVESIKPGATPSLSDLSFAGIKQAARQWMVINRRKRYVPGEPDRLKVLIGGSAGHGDLICVDHTGDPWSWSVVEDDSRCAPTPGGGSVGKPKRDRVGEMCQLLKSGPLSRRAVRDRLGISSGKTMKLLVNKAVQSNLVVVRPDDLLALPAGS